MSIVEDLLLSWERERAGEKTLTASVLQAQGNWTEKVTTVVVDSWTGLYRAAACDVTGGVASLNFDATELRIFKGNLGSPSNPNLQYGHFEPYH